MPASLNVLYLGDIVGNPGRLAVRQLLPELRKRYQPDLVIANAENIANGSGLTPELYDKLEQIGVDGMTLGDHVFKKAQIVPTLNKAKNLIRPANLSPQAPGKGAMVLHPRNEHGEPRREFDGVGVHVITVLGRIYMSNMPANDPFECVDRYLASLRDSRALVIVEVHAETSSEKVAMGWHLNGRVAAVVGTHTHVATADARLLPHRYDEQTDDPGPQRLAPDGGPVGTAYLTDLGMCGPHDSVLGRRVDRVLKQMTTGSYAAFDVAAGNPIANGVSLTLDVQTGLCRAIEPVSMPADVTQPPFVQ